MTASDLSQPTRRHIVKGAAWAAPAVAATAAAPLAAASPKIDCGAPEIAIGNLLTYYWADPVATQQTQTLKLSGLQFQVKNLPPGVKVDRIEWGMWIDIRATNRANWRNNGFPYPGAKVAGDRYSTIPRVEQPSCYGGDTCGWSNFSWKGATLNAQGEVTGGQTKRFQDNKDRPAWQLKTSWTNTGSNFVATNTNKCGFVLTGKMGVVNNNTVGRTQVQGTPNDSTWFSYRVEETGPTTADTYNYTIQGAIAYLSNGTTVSTSNGPTDKTPWV